MLMMIWVNEKSYGRVEMANIRAIFSYMNILETTVFLVVTATITWAVPRFYLIY